MDLKGWISTYDCVISTRKNNRPFNERIHCYTSSMPWHQLWFNETAVNVGAWMIDNIPLLYVDVIIYPCRGPDTWLIYVTVHLVCPVAVSQDPCIDWQYTGRLWSQVVVCPFWLLAIGLSRDCFIQYRVKFDCIISTVIGTWGGFTLPRLHNTPQSKNNVHICNDALYVMIYIFLDYLWAVLGR